MPIRWPAPARARACRGPARPSASWAGRSGPGSCAGGARRRRRSDDVAAGGGPAVDRAAQAVEDAAEQAGADRHRQRAAGGDDRGCRRRRRAGPSGMQVAGVAVQRDHLGAGSTRRRRSRLTSSPTAASSPATSTLSPTALVTRPVHRPGRRPASAAARVRSAVGVQDLEGRSSGPAPPAGASSAGRAGRRRCGRRPRRRAAGLDRGVGDEVTLPPARAPERSRQGGDVVGVQPHGDGRPAGAAAPGRGRPRRGPARRPARGRGRRAPRRCATARSAIVRSSSCRTGASRASSSAAARRSWSSVGGHCRSRGAAASASRSRRQPRLLVGPGRGLGPSGVVPLAVALRPALGAAWRSASATTASSAGSTSRGSAPYRATNGLVRRSAERRAGRAPSADRPRRTTVRWPSDDELIARIPSRSRSGRTPPARGSGRTMSACASSTCLTRTGPSRSISSTRFSAGPLRHVARRPCRGPRR